MNKKMMLGAVLGLAVMGASAAASAHVDVAVGLGVPVETYVPAQPVYAAPVVRLQRRLRPVLARASRMA